MTNDEMKALCRDYALWNRNEQAYLPQNITQAKTWEPHLWVLAAMEAAIQAAVAAAYEDAARRCMKIGSGAHTAITVAQELRARGAAHDSVVIAVGRK